MPSDDCGPWRHRPRTDTGQTVFLKPLCAQSSLWHPLWLLYLFDVPEELFTKSMPQKMKMTVKGGAAVDPDSGQFCWRVQIISSSIGINLQSHDVIAQFGTYVRVCCYFYKCCFILMPLSAELDHWISFPFGYISNSQIHVHILQVLRTLLMCLRRRVNHTMLFWAWLTFQGEQIPITSFKSCSQIKDLSECKLKLLEVKLSSESFLITKFIVLSFVLRFWVFRAWGRVGTTIGGNKLEKFMSRNNAVEHFMSIYGDKTGNDWSCHKKNFVKHPNKFYPLDIDYGAVSVSPVHVHCF